VHVIGRDGVDVAGKNALPQRFAVPALAQRRIDLADVAALPRDVVRQVMRTRLD